MDICTWLPTRPTPRPRDGKIIRCSNQLWKLSVTGGAWKGWREVVETPVCGPCGDFKVTRVGIIVPVLGTGRQWLESGQCQSELWIRSMELVPDWPDNYWITTWREDNATEAQHTSRALERNKSVVILTGMTQSERRLMVGESSQLECWLQQVWSQDLTRIVTHAGHYW